jgi:hypothetical protein
MRLRRLGCKMKNLLKAVLLGFMWIAFMYLTKEVLSTWAWYFFLVSGLVFFNILFQFPDGR